MRSAPSMARQAPGNADRLPAALLEAAVEDLLDQRRLARARHAGHGDEAGEGDRRRRCRGRLFARGAADAERERRAAARAAAPGRGSRARPVRIVGRRGAARRRAASAGGPAKTTAPPRSPAPGPEVDHVVGGADDGRVVLDDDDGVPLVAQAVEDARQALGVARVEADRRLVEHVERVHERRADGGGEVDALELAARERARLAVERQVLEARPRRGSGGGSGSRRGSTSATAAACAAGSGERREEARGVADRQAVHVGDGASADAEVERLRLARARRRTPGRGGSSGSARGRRARASCRCGPRASGTSRGCPDSRRARRRRSTSARCASRRGRATGRRSGCRVARQNLSSSPRSQAVALRRPRLDRAVGERASRVGDDEVEVEVDDAPEAAAGLAGAERAVEREEVRDRVAHREAAGGALERRREALDRRVAVGQRRPRRGRVPCASACSSESTRRRAVGARGGRGGPARRRVVPSTAGAVSAPSRSTTPCGAERAHEAGARASPARISAHGSPVSAAAPRR